jgi:hypothetical protein
MSGPEWGYLTIDGRSEPKRALSEAIWSDDSEYLAFVALHIEDVPNRKGAEGYSFRVGVMRISDSTLRYCVGNRGLTNIELVSFLNEQLSVRVDGMTKLIPLETIRWSA